MPDDPQTPLEQSELKDETVSSPPIPESTPVETTPATEEPVVPTPSEPEPVATEPSVPTAAVSEPQPAVPHISHEPKHTRRAIALIVLAIVLVAVGFAVWKFVINKNTATAPVVNATTNKAIVPIKQSANTTKTTFFTVPAKIADQHFFKDYRYFGTDCNGITVKTDADYAKCPPSISESDVEYYQIGTMTGGKPIISVTSNPSGDEMGVEAIALQTDATHFAILGQHDYSLYDDIQRKDTVALQDYKNILNSNVSLDTTTRISELQFPKTITINGMQLELSTYDKSRPDAPNGYFLANGLASVRGNYFTDPSDPAPAATKLGTNQNKTIYEVSAANQTNYQLKEVYATVNNVYAASYQVVDPLDDSNGNLKATWSSGQQTTDNYTSRSQGCGSANGYVVARGIGSDLVQIGTGPNGESLYQLPSDSGLFKEIYTQDYNGGSSLDDAALKNLTIDAFQAKHGVFLAKNALGEYVVYMSNNLIMTGGCGKPVIYLYPSATTTVNVQVGANVTKSAPTYGVNGWQQVTAQPNGQLTYQGKQYDSLFWEGLGLGAYPQITSGTVVARSQVVSTIRSQLQQQGLNSKEISDFLAFWQPKLPTTPYTRLTWFNTAQMNSLAPLKISQKPTTLIRTFLDFQGLQQPVTLPAQHFSTPVRKGFTVVEWGGLLHEQQ